MSRRTKAAGLIALFIAGTMVGGALNSALTAPVETVVNTVVETQTITETKTVTVETLSDECEAALVGAQHVLDVAKAVSASNGAWSGYISRAKQAIAAEDILTLSGLQVEGHDMDVESTDLYRDLGVLTSTYPALYAQCND